MSDNERQRLENLLLQVSDMISLIQNHKGPISDDISPRVLEEVERLEKAVAEFEDLNRQDFAAARIDIARLRTETEQSKQIPLKEKKLFQRAKEIEQDAYRLQLSFSKALERGKGNQKNSKQEASKQGIKDRRNRFKPLGGNKNWIPL